MTTPRRFVGTVELRSYIFDPYGRAKRGIHGPENAHDGSTQIGAARAADNSANGAHVITTEERRSVRRALSLQGQAGNVGARLVLVDSRDYVTEPGRQVGVCHGAYSIYEYDATDVSGAGRVSVD